MNDAIGQVLSMAAGVALSPLPIIGVVLMLGTPRARSNGPAFVLGWIVGLTLAGAIVLAVSSGAVTSDQTAPALWVSVGKLAIGLLLLLLAMRQWRNRPGAGDEAPAPRWLQTVDAFGAGKAAALGIMLSALNPKNLLLVVGSAAAIAQTGTSPAEQSLALAAFVLIGTFGTGTPVALYFAMGVRSKRTLERLKSWLAAHNAAILALIFLAIGAKLIGDALDGFHG